MTDTPISNKCSQLIKLETPLKIMAVRKLVQNSVGKKAYREEVHWKRRGQSGPVAVIPKKALFGMYLPNTGVGILVRAASLGRYFSSQLQYSQLVIEPWPNWGKTYSHEESLAATKICVDALRRNYEKTLGYRIWHKIQLDIRRMEEIGDLHGRDNNQHHRA